MEDFEYNKNGSIYKCWDLDAILNSNLITDKIKDVCKDKFNKQCYFKYNNNTKVGKLIGIEINTKLDDISYILEGLNTKYYITCTDTILKRL